MAVNSEANSISISDLSLTFPNGFVGLKSTGLQIQSGHFCTLLGPSGSGKSTLMKILSGVYPSGTYEGSIIYDGKELNLGVGSIRQARDEGIAIVYQELTLVPNMTVGENVFLGKEPVEKGTIDWGKLYAETRDILRKYRLEVSPQSVVKYLGVGKMQMVEIAKALSENAQILILDEPTSALTESEIDKLMEILENLRSHGVTCIYITHKLDEFFRITDSVTILRDGKTVTTQPTKQLTQEKLVSYMVGREMKERFPRGHRRPGEVMFEVTDLQAVDPNEPSRKVLAGVSFNLRRGEILGIAGLMGSGRTELVTTIFGEYGKITGGTIKLEGQEIHVSDARDAMHKGSSLVPEDRKGQGLILKLAVRVNMTLAHLDALSTVDFVRLGAERQIVNEYISRFEIRTPGMEQRVVNLSGGNQQKVVISKWLMLNPKILIMDEPTRGIDVGAKSEIYELMYELAAQGISIIMISSEFPELLAMCDRILCLAEGRITGEVTRADATLESLMHYCTLRKQVVTEDKAAERSVEGSVTP